MTPFIEIGAVLVALVALALAWRAVRTVRDLQAQVDRLQTALYEMRQADRSARQGLEGRLAELSVAVQKVTGNLRFDPNLPLGQLYDREPRAQAVLAAFHIGGCASCAVDDASTLAEAARERGADLDRVLAALNTLPEDGRAVELRVPNVRFEL